MRAAYGKMRLMSHDCFKPEGHVVCPGCSCSCHWDTVLVNYFIQKGRKQSKSLLLTCIKVDFQYVNLTEMIEKLELCHLLMD